MSIVQWVNEYCKIAESEVKTVLLAVGRVLAWNQIQNLIHSRQELYLIWSNILALHQYYF